VHADHHRVVGGYGCLILRDGVGCGERHEERDGGEGAGTGRHGRSLFESR
jgi:hypothetical protein